MRRLAIACCALALGCGGGNTRANDGGTAGGDLLPFVIESGLYLVSNLAREQDDCGLALDTSGHFATLAVRNDGFATIQLGVVLTPSSKPDGYTPNQYSLGGGNFSDSVHAQARTFAHVVRAVGADGGMPCEYDVVLDSAVTVTGRDALHVDLTSSDMHVTSACVTPPAGACTSKFHWDLAIAPPDMALHAGAASAF